MILMSALSVADPTPGEKKHYLSDRLNEHFFEFAPLSVIKSNLVAPLFSQESLVVVSRRGVSQEEF